MWSAPTIRGPILAESADMVSSEHPRDPETGRESGKVGWILLWLIGIPIPILLILYVMRGCT
jgi:hypothetical protein